MNINDIKEKDGVLVLIKGVYKIVYVYKVEEYNNSICGYIKKTGECEYTHIECAFSDIITIIDINKIDFSIEVIKTYCSNFGEPGQVLDVRDGYFFDLYGEMHYNPLWKNKKNIISSLNKTYQIDGSTRMYKAEFKLSEKNNIFQHKLYLYTKVADQIMKLAQEYLVIYQIDNCKYLLVGNGLYDIDYIYKHIDDVNSKLTSIDKIFICRYNIRLDQLNRNEFLFELIWSR